MRFLMKFGGTSVADAQCIARVVDILEQHHKARGRSCGRGISPAGGHRPAHRGCVGTPEQQRTHSAIEPLIQSLRIRHMTTLEGAAPDYIAEVGADHRRAAHQASQNILYAVHNLRELTPRSKDYIISFGERLLAPIVGAALRQRGIPSTVLDGCEAGILTTPQHGESTALPESDERIQQPDRSAADKEIPGHHGVHGMHTRRDPHHAREERFGLLCIDYRCRYRCRRDLDLDRCRRDHDL